MNNFTKQKIIKRKINNLIALFKISLEVLGLIAIGIGFSFIF